MPAFCRDCFRQFEGDRRCPDCGRPRIVRHPELFELSIAHMDCDAFFASVEKRDNPELRDKPVIIGGGQRGVVSTACYIARIKGVRSAMPMFKALQLCPEAVVVKPRTGAYVEASRAIRDMMNDLTPAIEPLSIDEAFLDLTGTERLHGEPPAVSLARLTKRMHDELGLTGSIGLSHNKFLAKLSSDLDKPHGYSVIGKAETEAFLADKPIKLIWGVGASMQNSLEKVGIRTFADLRRWDKAQLTARFGSMGSRLWYLARGQDRRQIKPSRVVKSISKETTFNTDTQSLDTLDGHLWRLSEQVSYRAKAKEMAGQVVTLKLKRSNHSSLTRRITLSAPTNMADEIYAQGRDLLEQAISEGPFRLIGIGISNLGPADLAPHTGNLFDQDAGKRAKAEEARDQINARFGKNAIIKGRALR